MTVEIRLLGREDGAILHHVAPDVFDFPIVPRWSSEFFDDPRHHLVVALDGELVVGFASGVHYVHPDKPPELWINEVGVAPTHHRQGIGRRLLAALLDHGASLGCVQAWVLTSPANTSARALYAGAGGREAPEHSTMFEFSLDPGSG
ncbi:MAG TPA: GNAT family N-acetyltransferase [Acidimicrobiia bacterium]|nr:GNAT family N-acetyltransferase [Acidimicrobiia bacterium]